MSGSNDTPLLQILIVEDRPVMRAMLCEFMRNAFPNCVILEADCGASALQLCTQHRPQLVLMDVCLPDANGIQLTERLIGLMPGLPVIVNSYLNGQVYVEQALAAGARAYVVKDRLYTDLVPAAVQALAPTALPMGNDQ